MIRPFCAIMHDTRRAARLPAIMDAIGGDGRLCADILVADGTNGGPWLALFKALYFGPARKTHTIVVEDDAILCRDFLDGAIRAIESRPDDALYLFASERQAGEQIEAARRNGCCWAEANPRRTIGTVAAIIPQRIAYPFLDWASTKEVTTLIACTVPHKPWTGDVRLWRFIVNQFGRLPLVSASSLADHDEEDVSQSLVGTHQTAPRRAPYFIGRDASAREVIFNDKVMRYAG